MKRDFSAIPLNMDGKPFIRPVVKYTPEGVPVATATGNPEFSHYEKMTFRLFAMEALAGRWKGDEGLTLEDASKRMKLHDRLCFSPDGTAELDAAECTLILDCMNKQGRDAICLYRMKSMLDSDPALASVTPIERPVDQLTKAP